MTVWGGNPARMLSSLPETYQETIEERCKSYYQRFRAV
jgi:dynactin-5